MVSMRRPSIAATAALVLAACSPSSFIPAPATSAASAAPAAESAADSPAFRSPAIASQPSAGGGLIAYERGEGSRLGIVASDGSGARELLPGFPGELYGVDWSPDGSKLVFYQLIPHLQASLYETDALGSTPRRLELGCRHSLGLTGCDEDDWPSYSPDGTHVAVVRWKGLWDPKIEPPPNSTVLADVDLATGEATELASTELPFERGENFKPRWSPDGTHLVFHRVHGGASGPIGSELWVVGSDGSDLQRITPEDLTAGDADWSPDGSLIVFSSFPLWSWAEVPGAVGPLHGEDIYTIRPDGTGLSRLTEDQHSAAPRWTPDGSILFTRLGADAAGTRTIADLWRMARDGSDQHAVTSHKDCCWWYGAPQAVPSP